MQSACFHEDRHLTLSLPQAIIIGFCKQHRSRCDGSLSWDTAFSTRQHVHSAETRLTYALAQSDLSSLFVPQCREKTDQTTVCRDLSESSLFAWRCCGSLTTHSSLQTLIRLPYAQTGLSLRWSHMQSGRRCTRLRTGRWLVIAAPDVHGRSM